MPTFTIVLLAENEPNDYISCLYDTLTKEYSALAEISETTITETETRTETNQTTNTKGTSNTDTKMNLKQSMIVKQSLRLKVLQSQTLVVWLLHKWKSIKFSINNTRYN